MNDFLEILKLLIAAAVGSLAFTLFFCSQPKRCIPSMLGGLITGGIYILLIRLTHQDFFSNMCAAAIAMIYCEICARVTRAPTVIYIIPALFPLVPGGALYYTISALVSGNYANALSNGKRTIEIALGISCGLMLISFIDSAVCKRKAKKVAASGQS